MVALISSDMKERLEGALFTDQRPAAEGEALSNAINFLAGCDITDSSQVTKLEIQKQYDVMFTALKAASLQADLMAITAQQQQDESSGVSRVNFVKKQKTIPAIEPSPESILLEDLGQEMRETCTKNGVAMVEAGGGRFK